MAPHYILQCDCDCTWRPSFVPFAPAELFNCNLPQDRQWQVCRGRTWAPWFLFSSPCPPCNAVNTPILLGTTFILPSFHSVRPTSLPFSLAPDRPTDRPSRSISHKGRSRQPASQLHRRCEQNVGVRRLEYVRKRKLQFRENHAFVISLIYPKRVSSSPSSISVRRASSFLSKINQWERRTDGRTLKTGRIFAPQPSPPSLFSSPSLPPSVGR